MFENRADFEDKFASAVMDLVPKKITNDFGTMPRVECDYVSNEPEKHIALRVKDVASEKWVWGVEGRLCSDKEKIVRGPRLPMANALHTCPAIA